MPMKATNLFISTVERERENVNIGLIGKILILKKPTRIIYLHVIEEKLKRLFLSISNILNNNGKNFSGGVSNEKTPSNNRLAL